MGQVVKHDENLIKRLAEKKARNETVSASVLR